MIHAVKDMYHKVVSVPKYAILNAVGVIAAEMTKPIKYPSATVRVLARKQFTYQ